MTPSPRFALEPIETICDVVASMEPDLPLGQIILAVEAVTRFRPAQRRLARALEERPDLLTSGVPEGLPMVDDLIRQLRRRGAEVLVQPRCGDCGKPHQRMSAHNANGVRICVTCFNRQNGRRSARPCANCGKAITVRFFDRNGDPRCEWCPPEPEVDHIEVICELVMAASQFSDRTALRSVITGCVRQPARRRQLAWDLQDNPGLLTGQAGSGSATVRRFVRALSISGVNIEAPRCPFCGKAGRVLESRRDGQPCCPSCYNDTRRTPCCRCGRELPISARTVDGSPLCWECTRTADFNCGTCADCGEFKPIAKRRNGSLTCYDCRSTPTATCSVCGEEKPCYFADSRTPKCIPCSRKDKVVACFACGNIRTVNTRDQQGNPLCHNCSRRIEECGTCHRMRPVAARVGTESRCWTCMKDEPALHRPCVACKEFGPVRYAGRCERCAAVHKLHQTLAGPDGRVADHLLPVQAALAASPSKSLMNWLKTTNATTLLTQLAAMPEPITHATIDQLAPKRGAGWLRHVLVAQRVLPIRDEYLHSFERWFQATLATVSNPHEQRMLSRYVTWSHLRRLRTAKTQTTPGQTASISNEVKGIVKLLKWLNDRGTPLLECTQSDIDQWCLQGGRLPHRPRNFIAWCVTRNHLSPLAIPAEKVRPDRYLLDDEERWATAKKLLHTGSASTADRVAGLLVLLYGQNASRIARLRRSDVVDEDGVLKLRLGSQPISLPAPLDALLRELIEQRPPWTASVDDPGWLFPGRNHGQPIHPQVLARRLKKAGASTRDGRNTALMHLAATLPTKVLSDLLGLSLAGAAGWGVLAGAGNADYAAEVARRSSAGGSGT